MAPIWQDRHDAFWLYVEQASANSQDKPYRQRVYRLQELKNGLFESRVYTFPDPRKHVQAWKEEDPLADLSPKDLEERKGCFIVLQWTGESFQGSTLGRLCESTLRGASFATSEVVLNPDRMLSWDRGFDAQGQHVWGADKGGYIFLRQ
jgi:hypothetical protein